MANLEKIVVTWQGFTGAPGYTTHFWAAGNATAVQAQLKQFYLGVIPYLPNPVSVSVPNNGEVIDEANGKMVNVWSAGSSATTNGTGGLNFASTSGALVQWNTNQFQNGRRVHGRTFLVPLSATYYGASGLITTTAANAIAGAATGLLNAVPNLMQCWSRPLYDRKVDPPVLIRPGKGYTISTGNCPTKVTYLSTRRD